MRKSEDWMKNLAGVLLVLFYCWGCAAPGSVGKAAKTEGKAGAQEQALLPDTALQKGADALLGVQIQDRQEDTLILLIGNGLVQNYQFRKLGEDRFILEFADIGKEAGLPNLPTHSAQVKLSYAEPVGTSSKGIQIIGSLRKPLDRYDLKNVGNDLVLTLNMIDDAAAQAKKRSNPLPESARSALKEPGSKPSLPPMTAAAIAEPRSLQTSKADRMSAPQGPGGARVLAKNYTGKPISLDLLEADLKNVLRLLADITGSNIVIEPDVKGQVTLRVEQVPWDQVLDMVLAMNGLGKEELNGVIRVATQAKLKEEWTSQTQEIMAKQELLDVARDSGEISAEYIYVNYADMADIEKKLDAVKSEKGKVAIDTRTRLLIYSDYPARLSAARDLVARLDKPNPQVLVEARFVQLNTDARNSLGIEWQFNSAHNTGSHEFNPDFQINQPIDGGDLFGFSWGQIAGDTLWRLKLQISALETAGKGKTISAPTVLTLDNSPAMISQGIDIPFVTTVIEDGVLTREVEFRKAVLSLEVTPHVTPDRKVMMKIAFKKETPNFNRFIVDLPAIDTREVRTELLIDTGKTVVIGGIIEDTENETMSGTPGLHKVPLLGRLFRADTERKETNELVVFITPHVIDDLNSLNNGRAPSAQKIK